MNILVIGSGGREHSLAWKIKQSPLVKELYCAPGNGGMAEIAECIDISVNDIEGLKKFAIERKIDLTIVGPEAPLVAGIVDSFHEENLVVFGPSKQAAQLEGSKIFAKKIMQKYGVPTADFRIFTNAKEAKNYLMDKEPPYVIKADGLAAGKGVLLPKTTTEAVEAVADILENNLFGDAGKALIVEDFVEGEELSILAFSDGNQVIPLASSQDHKRAFDNDEGPNTGGMGAYSPCPLIDHKDIETMVAKTIKPTIEGMKNEGIPFKGLIYAGLMISKKGPIVLEYNVRFGDPETQAVLPRMKDDIVPLFIKAAKGNLGDVHLRWDHRHCINVVLASGGYPGDYEKGQIISGLDQTKSMQDVYVFHAGTKNDEDGNIVTNGGRVLGISALGDTIKDAQQKAYTAVSAISFKDCFYRKDIANKAAQYITN